MTSHLLYNYLRLYILFIKSKLDFLPFITLDICDKLKPVMLDISFKVKLLLF